VPLGGAVGMLVMFALAAAPASASIDTTAGGIVAPARAASLSSAPLTGGAAAAAALSSTPHGRTAGQAAQEFLSSWPPDVFAVGTFEGIGGNVTATENVASIQLAVNDAEAWATKPANEASCGGVPCDSYVLLAPGDYKTVPGAIEAPPAGQDPAGVLINTANVWLVGMNRNSVIIDGTRSGPDCSTSPADQVYGPSGYASSRYGPRTRYRRKDAYEGLNGVMVWKAAGTWAENLTVCNFLDGSGGDGSAGNEIWWNGGAGSGHVFADRQGGYAGKYLTATSTFYAPGHNPYDPDPKAAGNPEESAATYGIFSSDWDGGRWNQTYASNFNDSGYYIGACQDECNQTVDHAWAENNALGYSGSNSGGPLVVENSQFDNNEDGFDTNSQNGDNPPPQNGACPAGVNPPVLTNPHTGRVYRPSTCWVFFHNYVHGNNNPNVPTYGSAAAGPVGTGMSLSGARNDTVVDNLFTHNDAWGNILVPYPDSGGPCTGGVLLPPDEPNETGSVCWFDESGDAVTGNTYKDNGSWGNPSNGDIAATNLLPGATDCFSGNHDASGLTTSPPEAELTYPQCTGMTVPPDLNAPFTDEVACDSGNIDIAGPITGATSCPPTIEGVAPNYPRQTTVTLQLLPGASSLQDPSSTTLPTMPNLCERLLHSGMGTNPWCR
jgi:hypothetical protein